MLTRDKLAELRYRWDKDRDLDYSEVGDLLGAVEKLFAVYEAAEKLVDQFKAIRDDHDQKLGKSFQEAVENWDSLKQGPLDFGPLFEALADGSYVDTP